MGEQPSKQPDPKAPSKSAEPARVASVTGKGPAPRFGKAHHIRNYKH